MVRLNELEQAAHVTQWSDLSASDQPYAAKWRNTINEILQLINPFTAQSGEKKKKK